MCAYMYIYIYIYNMGRPVALAGLRLDLRPGVVPLLSGGLLLIMSISIGSILGVVLLVVAVVLLLLLLSLVIS